MTGPIIKIEQRNPLESDLEELFDSITSWGGDLQILTPNLTLELACEQDYVLILH